MNPQKICVYKAGGLWYVYTPPDYTPRKPVVTPFGSQEDAMRHANYLAEFNVTATGGRR